jgi:uncharacterized protein YegL
MPDLRFEHGFPALPAGVMDVSLPVYLVIDDSRSMRGAASEAALYGVRTFKAQAEEDPYAAEMISVGLITFASVALLVGNGLVPVRDLALPALQADGCTRLDLAFQAMAESLRRDVRPRTAAQPTADFGPIAFVLTDGAPTTADGQLDDTAWRAAREAVLNPTLAGTARCRSIIVFGCGPDVNDETLKAISTGPAFHGEGIDFAPFFQFVSQTLTASVSARRDPAQLLMRLPAPRGVRRID